MKTKLVTSSESLEFISNETFVFCIELNKGFIKRDLSSLGITDYSFSTVVSTIEALTLTELESNGLNTVQFVNGEEKVSNLTEKKIQLQVNSFGNNHRTDTFVETFLNEYRAKADYLPIVLLQIY